MRTVLGWGLGYSRLIRPWNEILSDDIYSNLSLSVIYILCLLWCWELSRELTTKPLEIIWHQLVNTANSYPVCLFIIYLFVGVLLWYLYNFMVLIYTILLWSCDAWFGNIERSIFFKKKKKIKMLISGRSSLKRILIITKF